MSLEEDALIKLANTRYLQYCVQYSTIALLYYDYATTLPQEIRLVWRAKFRLPTFLYICCRYALVANVLYLLIIADQLGSRCQAIAKLISALSVLGRAAVITTFTLRTSAVCGGSKLIFGVLGAIGLACVILDIVHVAYVQCGGSSDTPLVNAVFVTLMCVFEFCSSIITIVRCYRVLGREMFGRLGFFHLLLEQGILYFLFTSLFTVAATVLSHAADPNNFFQRLLNALVLPLSCLLTARFILHLRAWEAVIQSGRALNTSRPGVQWGNNIDINDDDTQSEESQGGSIVFARPIDTNCAFFSTLANFGEDVSLVQGAERISIRLENRQTPASSSRVVVLV